MAVIFALFGTVVLAAVGIKLPGLEFKIRLLRRLTAKSLYSEDRPERLTPPTVGEFLVMFGKTISGCFSIICILMLQNFPICKLGFCCLMSR